MDQVQIKQQVLVVVVRVVMYHHGQFRIDIIIRVKMMDMVVEVEAIHLYHHGSNHSNHIKEEEEDSIIIIIIVIIINPIIIINKVR